MGQLSYLDFDLLIDQSKTGYRAQVLSAPVGAERATAEFVLPFDEKDIKILLLSMGQPRRNTRRMESQHTEEAKKFGGKLFEAVFNKDLWVCLRRSMEIAKRQDAGLRIRLQLTPDAQNLADLPWEYLYDRELNRFLALSSETPITRYLALPEPPRPLTVQPPLRVLVMISSPSDYPTLDVEREWSVLQEALQDVQRDGLVVAERLERPSLAALQRCLRRGQYHIFHFIGHGAFDEATQDGVLLLEDDGGRGHAVSGQELGTLLHDHRPLRLAILNACEGARSARSDPFAGAGQSLVQQGVSAVIAMQFEISDVAAIAFSHEFYAALTDGYPVDGALAEARKSIFSRVPDVEWGTPVLFMRAPDGRIFDLAPTPAPTAPAQPQTPTPSVPDTRRTAEPVTQTPPATTPARSIDLESRYTQALEDFYTEKWEQTIAILEEILAAQPTYPGAAEKIEHARRQFAQSADKVAELYRQGMLHLDAGRMAEAAEAFEQVCALSPGYKRVDALLERSHIGVLEAARRREAEAEAALQQALAEAFTRGVANFEAGQWRAAIADLHVVLDMRPDYVDPTHGRADEWLAHAQQQLDLAAMPAPKPRGGRPKDLPA